MMEAALRLTRRKSWPFPVNPYGNCPALRSA